ncbi:MAG: hypothetical protein JNK30_12595 [Phenylobacterium sp.]|uniref:hypothetical protein n=1 Tax=Phenylobacterium sp. TaxID=1871053 RepID=UPI001A37F387|nr:hypothetical protein [Phenylobacterium sp.]MBL8772212.1 hypothetical protein [Phenylobacterium sp.]
MSNSARAFRPLTRLCGLVVVLGVICGPAASQTGPKPTAPRTAPQPAAKPPAGPKPASKPAAKPVRKAAPAPPRISETGVLEQHELLAIAALGMKPSSDPFRSSPTAKYQGRDFVLYQTLRQANDTEYEETNGRWTYDKDAAEVSFAIKPGEFDVFYKETTVGRFTAQNAFGARWPAVHRELLQVIVDTGYHSADGFVVKAAPEEARSLTASVALKIEGTLTGSAEGVVSCDQDTDAATIDDPVQWDNVICRLSARLTTITLVDRRSGAALKTWTF